MKTKYKIFHLKFLYIFFIFLSLLIFFFSTTKVEGKAFYIDNIEISKPFEMNFNRNEVIDIGFKKAFSELLSLIVISSEKKKINQAKINEIKGMVESFSIKEEKFIDEVYHVNLGVSFNKKKIFKYLAEKNIFPSIPIKKKILFIPVIINENRSDLLLFSNNIILEEWNNYNSDFHLIDYILPSEDLEDLKLVKSKFSSIEKYDFKEITDKYDLEDSIVALFFNNERELRVLSKILINGNLLLKNQTFSNSNLKEMNKIKANIESLKTIYEDYWKSENQINTSIKLPINLKIQNLDNTKISKFEKSLTEIDLIYDFFISKFDKDFIYYKIIFNGSPNSFIKTMKENDHNLNFENNIWTLE